MTFETKADAMILLRPATLEDLPELLVLFQGVIRSTCRNDYSPVQIEVWTSSAANTDRWENSINKDLFLVAELNDKIIGFASLQGTNYFDFLYVHKDHLRKGIASQLYHAIERKALKGGSRTLCADVSITAKPFFLKQGFQVVHENRNVIKEIVLINYRMVKEL